MFHPTTNDRTTARHSGRQVACPTSRTYDVTSLDVGALDETAVRDASRLGILSSYGVLDTQPERASTTSCFWRRRFAPRRSPSSASSIATASGSSAGRLRALRDAARPLRLRSRARTHRPPSDRGPGAGTPHASEPAGDGRAVSALYAGAPLTTRRVNARHALRHRPRPRPNGLTPAQAEGLRALARQVMTLLVLRRNVLDRD